MHKIITQKSLFVLFAFFYLSLNSQNTNKGIIEYTVSLIKDEKKLDSLKSKKPFIYNVLKNQKDEKAILFFDNEKSLWSRVSNLEKDEKIKLNLTSIMMGGDSKYYTNLKKNEILIEKEFSGEKFIIKNNLLDWKLINETKKVNNYVLYKATAIKEIENRIGGLVKIQITAWYCPTIPIRFGPKEFSGLPGLILELKYGKRLNFLATKIELNVKKEIKIDSPNKRKSITDKEYNTIIKKSMLKIKKLRG